MLLGYTDAELANMGGYDLVHYDDLAYVASAHQECKKYVVINLVLKVLKEFLKHRNITLLQNVHKEVLSHHFSINMGIRNFLIK